MSRKLAPIIIKKRIVKGHGGHHGGAWKIAYADFVTAMMAFFLMMWLLSAVSDDQKKGIADYFAPNVVTMDFRQSGQAVLGGDNAQGKKSTRHDVKEDAPPAMQDRGEPNFSHKGGEAASAPESKDPPSKMAKDPKDVKIDDIVKVDQVNEKPNIQAQEGQKLAIKEDQAVIRPATREEKEKNDQKMLEKMEGQGGGLSDGQKKEQEVLRKIEADVEEVLKKHESWRPHIKMEIRREGLVLNIIDLEKKPLFTSGSAALCRYTQEILKELAKILSPLPNKLIISGHTDAYNYTNEKLYSNWELSCDRANSARRYLTAQGISRGRFQRVDGLEATEPINPDNIYAHENRRVRITIARDHPLDFEQLKTLSQAGANLVTTSSSTQPQQAAQP